MRNLLSLLLTAAVAYLHLSAALRHHGRTITGVFLPRRYCPSSGFPPRTRSFEHGVSRLALSVSSAAPYTTERVQRIKDISLQKEILKDITASEFAARLEVKLAAIKIDFPSLIDRLDKDTALLRKRGKEEENVLIERLVRTKAEVVEKFQILKEANLVTDGMNGDLSGNTDNIVLPNSKKNKKVSTANDLEMTAASGGAVVPTKRVEELRESLKVVVREDGSVDWEGAIASGREVAKFGTELWERLNGKDVEDGLPSLPELFGQVQAKEPETEDILRLKSGVAMVDRMLKEASGNRDDLKAKLRSARKGGLQLSHDDLQVLRKLDTKIKEIEKCLVILTVDLDIERICVYLQQELESSLEPAEQRLFVAEIALIDKQLSSLVGGIKVDRDVTNSLTDLLFPKSTRTSEAQSAYELISALLEDNKDNSDNMVDLLSLIDDDELKLISSEVVDLKGRLGLETSAGTSMNWGSLGVLVSDNVAKLKEGLSFYGEGTKMLLGDVQYGWRLLLRAAQGYTLKPREVNTVRRTGKDILTLVPFTIILLIPLSPIGHVLVFSFIQRFFPDFFPSCYTEKRLNLRRLYSEIEFKEDSEYLGNDSVDVFDLLPKFLSNFSVKMPGK